MTYKRMLFVSWGANLGGVASSTRARMMGLRELGIESEKLFFRPGAGLDTFADFPVFVSNSRKDFRKIVRVRNYDAISLVNSTLFLDTLRRTGYRGSIVYEVRGLGRSNLKACARLSPSHVDGVIVPSRYVAGLVAEALNGKRIPTRVVPNAVETARFRPLWRPDLSVIPEAARAAAPGARSSGSPRPILLWVGRLDDNKNWLEMLEILLRLHERGRDVQAWVVGDTNVGSDEKEFRRRVSQLGLEPYVQLIPCIPHRAMPDVYGLVAESGGCVFSTSRSEGFQNSLLEAMACGCPVVSSSVGGNVEMIDDGVNGYLYPLGDSESGATYIERLLDLSTTREEMVRRALYQVHMQHAPRQHAEAFVEALHSLSTQGERAKRLGHTSAASVAGPPQGGRAVPSVQRIATIATSRRSGRRRPSRRRSRRGNRRRRRLHRPHARSLRSRRASSRRRSRGRSRRQSRRDTPAAWRNATRDAQ